LRIEENFIIFFSFYFQNRIRCVAVGHSFMVNSLLPWNIDYSWVAADHVGDFIGTR